MNQMVSTTLSESYTTLTKVCPTEEAAVFSLAKESGFEECTLDVGLSQSVTIKGKTFQIR